MNIWFADTLILYEVRKWREVLVSRAEMLDSPLGLTKRSYLARHDACKDAFASLGLLGIGSTVENRVKVGKFVKRAMYTDDEASDSLVLNGCLVTKYEGWSLK